ncbi:MAG: ribosome silencing factor [Burkholderiaceae bacterium]
MITDTTAKRNTQRLQRAIVDGLEEVKAQDIKIFDTEHLSPLFERVIVASGTSNRQTKALAASVRDAVREAGFPKPRIEGEANGEWIIVDCAQAVVHIMQPTFRTYYHLEELWGEKPVRLKFGAAKPQEAPTAKATADKAKGAKKAAGSAGAGKRPAARDGTANKAASKSVVKAGAARCQRARRQPPAASLHTRQAARKICRLRPRWREKPAKWARQAARAQILPNRQRAQLQSLLPGSRLRARPDLS